MKSKFTNKHRKFYAIWSSVLAKMFQPLAILVLKIFSTYLILTTETKYK